MLRDPAIIAALLPTHAFLFILDRPFLAFVAMGAVVLSITGAEALYADMGHFGARAIRAAWFFLALPCLTLNYLGQGSLVLDSPSASSAPFFLLAPDWARLPLVVLTTMATVIASQAVISGAFSVSREAQRLGFLPRLTVRQTSEHEGGQIYVPSINWLLCGGVLLLIALFRTSERLATAYGLAVTGTLLLTTTLFLVHARTSWHWGRGRIIAVAAAFGILELAFFAANLTKVVHGGWLPLLIASSVTFVMLTWRRGGEVITERRTRLEGPLEGLGSFLAREKPIRVPGTAIFLHPNTPTIPLALRVNVHLNKTLHEQVLIVSTIVENVPHVPASERVRVEEIGSGAHQVLLVQLHFGFKDEQNAPMALLGADDARLHHEHTQAVYFLSRITIERSDDPVMSRARKRLFIAIAHNAASPITYFRLPQSRTVSLGSTVYL